MIWVLFESLFMRPPGPTRKLSGRLQCLGGWGLRDGLLHFSGNSTKKFVKRSSSKTSVFETAAFRQFSSHYWIILFLMLIKTGIFTRQNAIKDT
jgi:hypothetical protein